MSNLASILANLPPKERLALLDIMKNRELLEGKDRFDLSKILFGKQLQVADDAEEKNVVVCSRRCLAEGTLINTEHGLLSIEKIEVGMKVWGYNEDGSISLTPVLKVFNNGVKEVVTLLSCDGHKIECTLEHKFLIEDAKTEKREVLEVKHFTKTTQIVKVRNKVEKFFACKNLGCEKEVKTYDIHVGNTTNLYLLSDGTVTHNSGKSFFIATLMIHLCLTYPERFKTDKNGNTIKNAVVPENYVVYIGLNKSSARRVIWGTLMQLIRTYNVDCKPNEHELTISFPQQHIKIIVEGAKDAATIERLRGIHAIAAFVDEAQSLPIGLATDLVQSVVLPFLTDYDGKLYLLGTPDPLGLSVLRMAWDGTKSGWFGYKKFHWCVTDNIMFPRFLQGKSTPETYLQEVMEKSGFTVDSPQFIREYLGKFADDTDSLVYGFDYNRDTLLQLPPHILNWVYIISGDVGFSDSDAIIVIAFSYSYPTAFVVDEFSKSGLSADEFVLIYKEFCDKYNPIRSVIDYGGGGLKIIETINQRYGINVKPCKKWSPKTIGAAVLSSEFRSQRLKVLTSCDTTISQLESITWQTKIDRNGAMTRYIPDGKQVRDAHGAVISDDCADSLLYGLSELRNYLAVEDDFLTPEQQLHKELEEHRKKIVVDYNNELDGRSRESFY